MKPYILLLLSILVISACKPTTSPIAIPDKVTYIADSVYFEHEGWGGNYYGMYRITANSLTEDSVKRPGTAIVFNITHNDSLHQAVADIINDIPQAMTFYDGETFQDLSDPAPITINIVAFVGDETYSWRFWGIPSNLPEGTEAYVAKIKHLHTTMLSTR
ncbi:MAG: hypothetical protein H6551_04455 [Chitinophagales bacterium]|nr:hypothetical protein [Chitinophagales bacterium]